MRLTPTTPLWSPELIRYLRFACFKDPLQLPVYSLQPARQGVRRKKFWGLAQAWSFTGLCDYREAVPIGVSLAVASYPVVTLGRLIQS